MYSQHEKEGFVKSFETLRLFKRITSGKLAQDDQQEGQEIIKDLYVDLLPNNGVLRKLLSNNTFVLLGRRGTGKSTLFARAQYQIAKEKKNLSAYINAKAIMDDMKHKNSNVKLPKIEEVLEQDQFERLLLIKQFLNDLFKSLIDDIKKEEQGFFERLKSKFRDDKIDEVVQSITNKLEEPTLFKINSVLVQKSKETESKKFSTSSEVTGEASKSLKDSLLKLYAKLGTSRENTNGKENENINVFARLFDIGEIIADFKRLLDITGRNRLFIFIDDFSELSIEDMDVFYQAIINPIYQSARDEISIKIAAYPGRITYGELEPGKYDQESIDAFELYGKHYVDLEKKSSDFIKRLLENRLTHFCNSNLEKFFDVKDISIDEYCLLFYEATMNVPRTLGHVLSFCYDNAIVYDKPITKSVLMNAIESVYDKITQTYFEKEYRSLGVFKEKVDTYSQFHILESICDKSLELKASLPKSGNQQFVGLDYANTSHFQVQPNLVSFLDSLELNGLLHKTSVLAPKGDKGKNNNDVIIYSLDYGLCLNKKILYGRPERTAKYSKYYQQRKFDYSTLIVETLSSNKKVVCKNCSAEYDISELPEIEKWHMMCRECGQKTCEVDYNEKLKEMVHENLEKAIYHKEELDVLHVIGMFSNSASGIKPYPLEIGQELDITYQAVGRIAKKLIEDELLNRVEDTENRRRPYYKLTEKGRQLIKSIY